MQIPYKKFQIPDPCQISHSDIRTEEELYPHFQPPTQQVFVFTKKTLISIVTTLLGVNVSKSLLKAEI